MSDFHIQKGSGMVTVSGTFGFKRNDELQGNIITTTRSHSDFTITKTVEACEPTEVLRVGGAGHKVSLNTVHV